MKTIYVCNNCGNEFAKWHGMCPRCKTIDSLFEQKLDLNVKINTTSDSKPLHFSEIEEEEYQFIKTELSEVNKVLSGGFAVGSLNLIGGQPGIGKSTLILQIIHAFEKAKFKALYATGEESLAQVKARINRLKLNLTELLLSADTQIEVIIEQTLKAQANVLIIDSIQTMSISTQSAQAGSVNQIKASTLALMNFCKKNNITVFIIGHVTKEGDIAGPKLLEHMVDTVIYIEDSKHENLRFLKLQKNRYGSIEHLGILEMTEYGLKSVDHAAKYFIESKVQESGVTKSASIIGNRIFFFEVQSLLNRIDFGNPKRIASGVDNTKLNMLLAIIQKRANINLSMKDCYVKIVGEEKVANSSLDLALCVSIISSELDVVIDSKKLFVGSVSLTGEINPTKKLDRIIKEAEMLGINEIICANQEKSNGKVIIRNFEHINQVVKEIFGG